MSSGGRGPLYVFLDEGGNFDFSGLTGVTPCLLHCKVKVWLVASGLAGI